MPGNRLYQSAVTYISTKLATFNIYESPNANAETIHRGILATRLFLVLLIVVTIGLSMGAFLRENIVTETVESPTRATFVSLYERHSDSLTCPCTNIAIPFGQFSNVQPSFHQVCSSDFVSQPWIDFVFGASATSVWIMDIRTSLSSMWQLIASLCQSSISSVHSGTGEFKHRLLISSTVLSEEVLKSKSSTALDENKLKMKVDFHALFGMFYMAIMVTMPAAGLMTNVGFYAPHLWDGVVGMIRPAGVRYVLPETYSICDCYWQNSCELRGNIYLYSPWETYDYYNLNVIKSNGTIPGLLVNCIPFQALSNSTLECFYDSDCLQYLISVYPRTITISPLDTTLPSRFNSSTKISQLFTDLFIEDIVMMINHSQYYDECDPISCTFTYSNRYNLIYVITTLVALFGGLSVVLRLVCPYMIDMALFIRRRLCMRTENQQQQQQDQTISLLDRVKNLVLKINSSVVELNVFDDPAYDQSDVRTARIFTRLYLAFIYFGVIIIAFYTFVSKETVTKTIVLPSLSQYENLEEIYKDALSCPCRTISISYRNIIEIEPVYHQLCQSDFVQNEWIKSIKATPGTYSIADFRTIHIPYFFSLTLICSIFQEKLANATKTFLMTEYTNTHAIPRNMFISQINSTISDFQTSTKAQFSYGFSMINSTLSAEQYMSLSLSNVAAYTINWILDYKYPLEPVQVVTTSLGDASADREGCTCVRDASCTWNWDATGIWIVDGIKIRCNFLETVFRSTLVCLYNTRCVDELKSNLNSENVAFIANARPLNSSLQSRYSPDTPLKTIFDEMMVESWNSNSSYEIFYELCQPSYCTFTYERQFSILYAIVTLTGLIGGLNLVLRWICFFLMKFVSLIIYMAQGRTRNVRHDTQEIVDSQSVPVTQSSPWIVVKSKLLSLNVFRTESNEIRDVTQQLYSTRLYILMLVLCLWIITVYEAKSSQSVISTFMTPSEQEYQNILELQTSKLSCPCQTISFPHNIFINMNAVYHQVCASDFVDDPWIDFLYGNSMWSLLNRSDIRGRGAAYFSFLSVLCSLTQTSINKSINDMLETIWISAQPIPEKDFQLQTDAVIERFVTSTNDNIVRILHTMHNYLYSNSFMSAYFLNWKLWIKDIYYQSPSILASPNKLNNGTCSCATRSDCREPAGIYADFETSPRWTVPGFYAACSVYDSLMQSTLECFYSQECISALQGYSMTIGSIVISRQNNNTFKPLDSARQSRFLVNSSILELVNELFVEEWITNVSYSAFYEQCGPIYCSYTMQRPNSIVYIVGRILGLYGGLTLALRLMIPRVVMIYLIMRNRFMSNRVSSLSQR